MDSRQKMQFQEVSCNAFTRTQLHFFAVYIRLHSNVSHCTFSVAHFDNACKKCIAIKIQEYGAQAFC